MNIVHRNFFRLLRIGAFNTDEQIEPMSVSKWSRLYQLSIMHDVTAYIYDGLQRSRNQFFVHLTEQQWQEWETAANKPHRSDPMEMEEDDLLRPDHLTNPVLNHQLQTILDDEESDTTTRRLLLIIIRIARHLLNEGMPVHQLLELGYFLRNEGRRADFTILRQWINSLRMTQMAQLECEMLVLLYGFTHEELSFIEEKKDKRIEKIAQELVEFTNTRSQDWYFSQEGDNIFVRNNTSAMFSHVRRSARYFRYYPSESITNFFASFVHSLSHIEE